MKTRPNSVAVKFNNRENLDKHYVLSPNVPRIYLSGPMSGITDNNKFNFDYWEKYWLDKGCEVVNPLNIPHDDTENKLWTLLEDFDEEEFCTVIFFLRGWEKSKGCLAEWGYAAAKCKDFLFEGPNRSYSTFAHKTDEMSEKDIIELELSVRSYNCLKRARINTIGDLVHFASDDEKWFLKVRNLGRRSHEDIVERVKIVAGIDIP